MRTINLHLTKEDMDARGELGCGYERDHALTYLSQWSMDTYPVVDIYTDGPHSLTACYRREDGSTAYVIGAIWREAEGQYTFHS